MSARTRVLHAVVVAVLVLGTAACGAAPGSSVEATSTTFAGPPPALPSATTDALAQLETRYGSDPTPTARYAFGTRHQARRVLGLGDLPKGEVDSAVFVVVVDGAFDLAGAGGPEDTSAPKGRYLVAMFERTQPGVPVELGVTDLAPRLERVGQVADVPVSS